MHIYFVRHGSTVLNDLHVHQSPGTSLSPKGYDQALSVGESLRSVNPDLLISSEYTRARETARVIGECVGLTPEVSDFFYEVSRPSSLFGKSHFHPKTLVYVFLSTLMRNRPSWHFEDAENFSDIKMRATRALTYLESLTPTHASVIVVSHTIFINMMISYMCQNKMYDLKSLILTILHIKQMKNTDVIHVECMGRTNKNSCVWSVVYEV
ncbi:histidine phosphatase family protein [Candidatus Kaiserbacteria bacterium]|nr:MAG: histidine phosphatase family protein [Candidatus Kaiserbacteria bacterium]